jgi:hypothetical protein
MNEQILGKLHGQHVNLLSDASSSLVLRFICQKIVYIQWKFVVPLDVSFATSI